MATRPERVPAEEIRQRMLDAGRELAMEAGAALTIEHLRLEEVIQRARVPRSSAYRLWPYKEDYIDDLLCYLAGEGSWFSDRPVLSPDTTVVVGQLIEANRPLLATSSGRRSLLCEIVRLTAEGNYWSLSESATWRLHMALVATLGATGGGGSHEGGLGEVAGGGLGEVAGGGRDAAAEGGRDWVAGGRAARQRVAAALEEAQSRSREMMVRVFGQVAAELGLRLRDPSWTVEHLQLAGGLFVQSLALRNVQVQAALGPAAAGGSSPGAGGLAAHVNDLLNTPVSGPGLHGTTAEWTLASLGYLGIVDAFVELDPDFAPPQDSSPAG